MAHRSVVIGRVPDRQHPHRYGRARSVPRKKGQRRHFLESKARERDQSDPHHGLQHFSRPSLMTVHESEVITQLLESIDQGNPHAAEELEMSKTHFVLIQLVTADEIGESLRRESHSLRHPRLSINLCY